MFSASIYLKLTPKEMFIKLMNPASFSKNKLLNATSLILMYWELVMLKMIEELNLEFAIVKFLIIKESKLSRKN